jgi:hypothetical protein
VVILVEKLLEIRYLEDYETVNIQIISEKKTVKEANRDKMAHNTD